MLTVGLLVGTSSGVIAKGVEVAETLTTIHLFEGTSVVLDETALAILSENDISLVAFESAARVQVAEYLEANGLSANNEVIALNQAPQTRESAPPGSTINTYSGRNTGAVFAGIPAIGITDMNIDYSYNYTKWVHTLYQMSGYILNSGTVHTSYFSSFLSLSTWQHLSGNVVYANSSYGHNLEVTTNGIMTTQIPIIIAGISIPANAATRQSFIYFHAL